MTITDEQLSAFLDAELPENEMEFIRQKISEDETLANRLAELAMVDEQIAQHYSAIDTQPLPEATVQLLSAATQAQEQSNSQRHQSRANNVVDFPWWKKMPRGLQLHAAVAACLVLVMGYGFIHLLPTQTDSSADNWSAIATALDTTTSGTEQMLAEGKSIKPRLTFIDQQGNYCRQYRVSETSNSAEGIACRINGKWESKVTVNIQDAQQQFDYQTASNGASILDQVLDSMMHGEAFDAQAETNIIHQGWKKN